MRNIYQISLLGLSIVLIYMDSALASPRPISQISQQEFVTSGLMRGGEAGDGFTLIGIRRHFEKSSNLERIVLDIGNQRGGSGLSRPGYYQMVIDPKSSRLVLDLYQIAASQISPSDFVQELKKSPLVSSARMLYDPEDRGLSIEIILNGKVKAKAYEFSPSSKGARLVLDLQKIKSM